MQPGEITADVICAYKNACFGYFDNKKIADDKQAHKILASLCNSRVQDWIAMDCDRFLALIFVDFMREFCATYLLKDWEEITCIELLGMTQKDNAFWAFSVEVQVKNSILRNTQSHLTKKQMHHHLEAGMDMKLALRCHLEKSNNVLQFKD